MYMTVKPEPNDYFTREFIKECGPEKYEQLRQYIRDCGYRVSDSYGAFNINEDEDKRCFLRLFNDGDLVWTYGVNPDDRCLDLFVDFDEPPFDAIELNALQAIHSVTNNILTDNTVKDIYRALKKIMVPADPELVPIIDYRGYEVCKQAGLYLVMNNSRVLTRCTTRSQAVGYIDRLKSCLE